MAHILSQKKRNRQNEKRKTHNSRVKSSIRTIIKNIIKAINSKEKNIEEIQTLYKKFVKTIDKAVKKGIVHYKTAARKKSRIAHKVNLVNQKQ